MFISLNIPQKRYVRNALFTILIISFLEICIQHSYLLFHVFVEFIAIAIAFGLYTITWSSRKNIDNQHLLLFGLSALFIGILDMFHTVTYKGMDILPDGPFYYANQFWVATRFIEAVTLVLGIFFLKRKTKIYPELVLFIYGFITLMVILSILYWKVFPECYIEGIGQTHFKIYSEYVIIAILMLAIFFLYQNKKSFDTGVYRLLFASISFAVVSEFSFSLYVSNYGIANEVGHYAKLATFLLIYKANIETGVRKPTRTIFWALKESEKKYKELSDKLQKKNEEYVVLNTKLNEVNATKDRFISILAHDLKNPFASLLGFSDLLLKEIESYDKAKIRMYVERFYSVSNETYNLLTSLLEWSRNQSDKAIYNPRITNLNKLIDETYHLIIHTASAKYQTIRIEISEQIDVEIDAEMIKTVIRNLLSNAVKYTHENGVIIIKASKSKENVEIMISDTGTGMDEQTKNSLFKIDETKSLRGTHGEKGTGFGLLLCKEFVEKHKGHIKVESEPDKGSTFTIALPLSINKTRESEKYKSTTKV